MSEEFKFDQPIAVAVAEEAMWLAWQACGGPLGIGILQDNASASKQDVMTNLWTQGDYAGGRDMRGLDEGEYYGDYVFGRMMKTGIKVTGPDTIVVNTAADKKDGSLNPEYVGWCQAYSTREALITAAKEIVLIKQIFRVDTN